MTTTISVPAKRLRQMLAAVLPCCALADDDLPALEAVQFSAESGVLYLAATDRYTLGVARCRVPGAGPGAALTALLPAEAASEMRGTLDGLTGVAALTFGPSSVEIDLGDDGLDAWATSADVRHFPEWRPTLAALIAGSTGELDPAFAVSPVHLAKLTAPGEDDEAAECASPLGLRVAVSDVMPGALLVTRDSWFIGAVLPCRRRPRRGSDVPADEFGEWASALTAPAQDAAGAPGPELAAVPGA